MPSLKKLQRKKTSIPVLTLEQCAGKTFEGQLGMTTYEHCRIVGHIAKIFRRILPKYQRKKLPRSIVILAALHDIGKVSPGFVMKIYGAIGKKTKTHLDDYSIGAFETKHAAISEASFNAQFGYKKQASIYGSILGVHHGERGVIVRQDSHDYYGGPGWAELRKKLTKKLIREFGDLNLKKLHSFDSEIISGFISLCDWIGSDEHYFPASGNIKDIHAKAIKAIRDLGWKKTVIKQNLKFMDLFGFKPYKEQDKFISSVKKPGVYIFEDRTGRGKTEAALAAAYNLIAQGFHDGFYYALPTRITSQRIHKRVCRFTERAFEDGMAPHLIHGQSFIADVPIGNGELAPGGMWFTSNRRALMLPFGIGTVDQILMSILHTKYNFIRTFGLANKVVIIDEYHSYDAYTGKLTDLLIEKLRALNCTVIILSATLTSDRKKDLLKCPNVYKDIRYPLITVKTGTRTYSKSAGESKSRLIKVRKVKINYPKLFKEVQRRVLAGQQVLWIFNTVDRAVTVYKIMRTKTSLSGLIHSRFPGIDRNMLEETWMERLGNGPGKDRSTGSLLISTQVLEQSVDVDADFLITDIAPSDFIIQRLGRIFRHENENRPCSMPEVWILCPELSGITSLKDLRKAFGIHSKIYSPYVLWRSYRTWKRLGIISDPDDLRVILENTYRDAIPQDPLWVQEAFEDLKDRIKAMKQLAEASTGSNVIVLDDEDDYIPVDVIDDDEYNPTRRLSVPTQQLLLLESMSETNNEVCLNFIDGESISFIKGKRSLEISKTVTYRLVKVPSNKILESAISPDWLKKIVFGGPIPVRVDSKGKVLLGNTDTGYMYERDCGVYKPI